MRNGLEKDATVDWKDRALVALATAAVAALAFAGDARAATLEQKPAAKPSLEKEEIKLGFIKLTDCAPLIVAKEKGFFDAEGLFVTLEAQANWKTLMDRVIDGELDGSHMLAPAPLGHTEGLLTKPTSSCPT